MDPEDGAFRERILLVLDAPLGRARRMVEKLNAMGVAIRWERVQELPGNENVGRPHVARAMVETGYIQQVSEAFTEEYIAVGGRAYVERYKLTPEEGIDLIRSAGGVPVLAHPGRFRAEDDPLPDAFMERLARAGLMGVEVFYPRHTEAMVRHYRELAEDWA
ncbi:PHP domain-containing protein [Limnochorda pilosa]|uniref:Phosphotransferase n=1 Tax=Limnochorda pilosa TaxID=1555112 RepID=A0A0K2SM63_LIMPI|nr:hypothetical protein [Limnochorda pilosa]BAS28107.1 phosphotransferase [Limnochorda pilosa]